jgi:hypothetical protein
MAQSDLEYSYALLARDSDALRSPPPSFHSRCPEVGTQAKSRHCCGRRLLPALALSRSGVGNELAVCSGSWIETRIGPALWREQCSVIAEVGLEFGRQNVKRLRRQIANRESAHTDPCRFYPAVQQNRRRHGCQRRAMTRNSCRFSHSGWERATRDVWHTSESRLNQCGREGLCSRLA